MLKCKVLENRPRLNASGLVTSPLSVAFQMVQSNEISQAGNAGKKEDFEKLKQRLKNNNRGTENLKRVSVLAVRKHYSKYIHFKSFLLSNKTQNTQLQVANKYRATQLLLLPRNNEDQILICENLIRSKTWKNKYVIHVSKTCSYNIHKSKSQS